MYLEYDNMFQEDVFNSYQQSSSAGNDVIQRDLADETPPSASPSTEDTPAGFPDDNPAAFPGEDPATSPVYTGEDPTSSPLDANQAPIFMDDPTPSPTKMAPSPNRLPMPTPAPVAASSNQQKNSSSGEDSKNKTVFVLIPIVAVVAFFVCYRFYRNLRRKREQHLLNLRSAQADSVLGDMQMIPSEDPDSELL
ncbi:hypothetical protein ACA910_022366 [Epithemia clementina (nom. ined.)]